MIDLNPRSHKLATGNFESLLEGIRDKNLDLEDRLDAVGLLIYYIETDNHIDITTNLKKITDELKVESTEESEELLECATSILGKFDFYKDRREDLNFLIEQHASNNDYTASMLLERFEEGENGTQVKLAINDAEQEKNSLIRPEYRDSFNFENIKLPETMRYKGKDLTLSGINLEELEKVIEWNLSCKTFSASSVNINPNNSTESLTIQEKVIGRQKDILSEENLSAALNEIGISYKNKK